MSTRHALVIAVDGLRASAVGAYGNAWYETPALDALASESQVVDWMWCESPVLADFYRGAWTGVGARSLPNLLAQVGVASALVTDDAATAQSADFAEIIRVESDADQTAATIDETAMAQLFAVAAEQLLGSKPGLLWIHARGFHGPWDAPLPLRAELLDDDDPPPAEFVAPPDFVTIADQDEALVYRAAYAAQAVVLDDCVGGLLAALAQSPLDSKTLVVVVGTRGFALGEHGTVGGDVRNLYSELLHIPCLLRVPGAEAPLARSLRLAQPIDLFVTLLNWFGVAIPAHAASAADLLASDDESATASRQWIAAHGDDGELAARTAAWMLRRLPRSDGVVSPVVELYAKPDDRWEANEISDRCPDVAERLLAAIEPSADGSLGLLDDDLSVAFR